MLTSLGTIAAWFVIFGFGWMFAVSGASKLPVIILDKQQHYPDGISRPLYGIVVACELLVGAMIVSGVGTFAGVAGGVVLLTLFTAWLLLQLRNPDRGACGCFKGLFQDTKVSFWHVLRNCCLLAVGGAALVLSNPYNESTDYLEGDGPLIAFLLLLVTLLLASNLFLVYRIGKLVVSGSEGSEQLAPDLARDGIEVPLGNATDLALSSPFWLILVSSSCPHCVDLLRSIEREGMSDRILVVSSDQPFMDTPLRWYVDQESTLFEALEPPGTPAAVLTRDGLAVGELILGSDMIEVALSNSIFA